MLCLILVVHDMSTDNNAMQVSSIYKGEQLNML